MESTPDNPKQKFTRHFVVRPQDLNHAGTAFCGTMMAHADEQAYIAATLSYPGCTFVTKLFSEFNFVRGAVEGDIVRIESEVLGKGRSSVRVAVTAVHAISGQEFFRTEAVLVNAREGRSVAIPE
ncbi:MAG TPA: hotdog domain-containing protein [Verrucomicrobium sp.]|nr:hotdog domain-containing protein [Verrucomicrobium sp.]